MANLKEGKFKKFLKNVFKRKVNEYEIESILQDFVNNAKGIDMIISYEITRMGIVKLYTNRPCTIIGRYGKDLQIITDKMKKYCNAKGVKVFEIKMVNNCELY